MQNFDKSFDVGPSSLNKVKASAIHLTTEWMLDEIPRASIRAAEEGGFFLEASGIKKHKMGRNDSLSE